MNYATFTLFLMITILQLVLMDLTIHFFPARQINGINLEKELTIFECLFTKVQRETTK